MYNVPQEYSVDEHWTAQAHSFTHDTIKHSRTQTNELNLL